MQVCIFLYTFFSRTKIQNWNFKVFSRLTLAFNESIILINHHIKKINLDKGKKRKIIVFCMCYKIIDEAIGPGIFLNAGLCFLQMCTVAVSQHLYSRQAAGLVVSAYPHLSAFFTLNFIPEYWDCFYHTKLCFLFFCCFYFFINMTVEYNITSLVFLSKQSL